MEGERVGRGREDKRVVVRKGSWSRYKTKGHYWSPIEG